MTSFTISIAGQIVRIDAIHERMKLFCKDYLCEGEPDLVIVSDWDGIAYERKKSALEHQRIGRDEPNFPDDYLESLSVYRKLVQALLEKDILLIHGSAISVDGEAFLFSATSGTGKSTHTRFWREQFGDRAVMINDDKPLIQVTEEGAFVYGTPWNGKHRLGTNTSAPLKAFCILERGSENKVTPISPTEALPMLMQQTSHPANPAEMDRFLKVVDRLSKAISFYRLSCTLDPNAAVVSYEGMTGKTAHL